MTETKLPSPCTMTTNPLVALPVASKPLNILVVGAGVGGPAFATLIQGADHRHNITVVERSPFLRATGHQIDLKGQGMPIVSKMSLLETVKSYAISEPGMELVDPNGKRVLHFSAADEFKSEMAKAATSDCEIMRGDLVKVFYEASLKARARLTKSFGNEGGLTYEFGKTVTELTQSADAVKVTFSNGQERQYDLVVGADGQGSCTRRLAFGTEVSVEAFKSLGTFTAFYDIPRAEAETATAKVYMGPGRRGIMTRTGDRAVTQVFLFSQANQEVLRQSLKEPVARQKEVWTTTMTGAGWETERFLRGMKDCHDFYACELAQVKMQQWSKGRVVLLGDAGYSPSVMTGMGTTCSLVGAYVLAGELARHGDDIPAALEEYERVARPAVAGYQVIPTGMSSNFFPSSRLGLWFSRNALWAMSALKIDQLLLRVLPKREDKFDWTIPDYPELNLKPLNSSPLET
ncbi:hypothetical protein PV04_08935 [Phialophora macrospora]|uniref:FAD-binding domain-containing protein n=1 Tax=Phialophora macrospora TaxID=1851006 RepID=A0A0D2FAV7_9EURO|nr:hypothetical protein PV04_08935 [Phialophora macrospora]